LDRAGQRDPIEGDEGARRPPEQKRQERREARDREAAGEGAREARAQADAFRDRLQKWDQRPEGQGEQDGQEGRARTARTLEAQGRDQGILNSGCGRPSP
jgi:hypothetical protein